MSLATKPDAELQELPDPLQLLSLPDDLLVAVLSLVGCRSVAFSACTCVTLRRLKLELENRAPAFNTRAALWPLADSSQKKASVRLAAAGAAREAASRLCVRADAATVFVASDAAEHVQEALEAVLAVLPPGCVGLATSTPNVAGPFRNGGTLNYVMKDAEAHGVPMTSGRAVCVLLMELPRGTRAVLADTDSSLPASPTEARAWLSGGGEAGDLLWCALFWTGQALDYSVGASPPVVRAWPRAAFVGGVAAGGRSARFRGSVACGGAGREVRIRKAAALSIFSTDASLRCGSRGLRGLRRFPAAWTVHELHEVPYNHPESAVLPFLIETRAKATLSVEEVATMVAMHGARLAVAEPGAGADFAEELVNVRRGAEGELHGAYIKLWADGKGDGAGLAEAAELEVTLTEDLEVLVWGSRAQLASPAVRSALADGRLRLQGFCIDPLEAAEEAQAASASLAASLPPGPKCVLAAACSGRGGALFARVGEEADAVAASFPDAFVCCTVNGELGAPPGWCSPPAIVQTFTTVTAALG